MSAGIDLDLQVPFERFRLQVAWRPESDALAVFGPSGAGKTTLLESLAGIRPARGRIVVDGRTWLDDERGIRLPAERRGIGFVPQEASLFPHLDVAGNLSAGSRKRRHRPEESAERQRVIETLELQPLLHRRTERLSGGEKKRVALARALCSRPRLLLLDEPLAGLDRTLARRALSDLLRIRERFDIPTLIVSHDVGEVRMLADSVLVLNDGREVTSGSPAQVFTDPRVLPLVRSGGCENIVAGRVRRLERHVAEVEAESGVRLRIPGHGLREDSRVVVGLRAEDLILAVGPAARLSAQNRLAGRVRSIRELADGEGVDAQILVVVDVEPGGMPWLVAITDGARRELEIESGREVGLLFKTHACRILADP